MDRAKPISEFCLKVCPFNKGKKICQCLDEKNDCPVDWFIRYLAIYETYKDK